MVYDIMMKTSIVTYLTSLETPEALVLKKWAKEKGTFVEVGKLLDDSCRSNQVKKSGALRESLSITVTESQSLCGKLGILFFWVKRCEHTRSWCKKTMW